MNFLQWAGCMMVLLGLLQIYFGADLQRREVNRLRSQAEHYERAANGWKQASDKFEAAAKTNLDTAKRALGIKR